jgi:monovalent cation:H+ antiporter, CPA1 family
LVILELAVSRAQISGPHIIALFLEEAGGGLLFGIAAGYVVYSMLRRIDNYQVEILLTLALAMGVYALAETLPIFNLGANRSGRRRPTDWQPWPRLRDVG